MFANDTICLEEAGNMIRFLFHRDHVIPVDAGICLDIIRSTALQDILAFVWGTAIAEAFGWRIVTPSGSTWGIGTVIMKGDDEPLFTGLPI
jgi:hypothetical protein